MRKDRIFIVSNTTDQLINWHETKSAAASKRSRVIQEFTLTLLSLTNHDLIILFTMTSLSLIHYYYTHLFIQTGTKLKLSDIK